MKESKAEKLINYLVTESNHWISSALLSDYLSVSTRQIRKYITVINQETQRPLILSSKQGYQIDMHVYREEVLHKKQQHDTPLTRVLYIIQKLVSEKNGYDIFDFCDELFVSSSTIENDLKEVRQSIKRFDLYLTREHDMLYLNGEEKNKRSLMSYLISSDSYDNFILKDEVRFLTFHYHYWDFRSTIKDIFVKNDIFVNDYTLNNTALHLIIMIDRIRNQCVLENTNDLEKVKNTRQYLVAQEIKKYIENTYKDVHINQAELYNLVLVISNNTTLIDYSFITAENMNEYIEQYYIDIAQNVLKKVCECYYLESFDDDFITKFTLHVKNLFNRAENHYFIKNPLTSKIKNSFPLIYDIAVFIAQEFKNDYHITLTEDEITFIAFHIGSYFENNVQGKTKVSCGFIYADYYSIHENTLNKILSKFEDKINIKYAVSIQKYHAETMECDFIISTIEMPFPVPSITIHPFLTDRDIVKIRHVVDNIILKKKNNTLKTYLIDFFDEQLFYKNPNFMNKFDAIQTMSNDVISLGYAQDTFYDDVLAREKMSSTAFLDVAVPHSLSKNVHKSFISIALNTTPISWGKHKVSIIALIGVSADSRKIFAELFDTLIEILSEPIHVKELLKSATFEEFIETLKTLMDYITTNDNI